MDRRKQVKEAVVRKYPFVSLDDTLDTAIKSMAEHNSSVLVVMLDETFIGIVTVSDVIHSLANNQDRNETKIRDFMTECEVISETGSKNPCVQLDESQDVISAIKVLYEAGVNHLVVAGSSGTPVGVVSSLELVKVLAAE